MALVASIRTGDDVWGDIYCVSVHLENKCNPEQRREQFQFLVEKLLENENIDASSSKIIIGGDMNTFATGFAKFYDLHSSGDMWDRCKALGYSEAATWELEMSSLVGEKGLFQDPFDKRNDITFRVRKNYFTWYSAKLDWILFCNFDLSSIESKRVGGNTEGTQGVRSSDHCWLIVTFNLNK